MRVYFVKSGHILAVRNLTANDDAARIAEARDLFESDGKKREAEGFEVWDGSRFVYRYPAPNGNPGHPGVFRDNG